MKTKLFKKMVVLTTVLTMVFATPVFADLQTDPTGTIPVITVLEKTETMKTNVAAGSTIQIANNTDAPLSVYMNGQPIGMVDARIEYPGMPGIYLTYSILGSVDANGILTAKYKKNSHKLNCTLKVDNTAQKANIKAMIAQYTALMNNAAAIGDVNTQVLCQQLINDLNAQLAVLK